MKFPFPSFRVTLPSHLLLAACLVAVSHQKLSAWGQPHLAITKAALEVLPAWQKETLGSELTPLGDNYCLIPDHVYTDKENAKFASMESMPGEVYVKKLHLPTPEQGENLETFRYFMDKAVEAFKAGQVGEAARYMGTICHVIEDFGSPSHTVPGDNMFTLLQQFMPPSEKMKDQLLHGPIENGTFDVSIKDYQPRLLGVTVEEASWRLLHRVHEGTINARSTTVPIIQALYAGDDDAVLKHQLKAATVDAQIVADALYTLICLGKARFEPVADESLRSAGISHFWPVEAVHLYYPQTHFFSSPYWGHARVGVVLEEGKKAVPIRLRLPSNQGFEEREFPDGISTGMGKALTWILPQGIYHRFTVWAGLQAGLGDKGRVEFTIMGDGKPLASAVIKGTDAAHAFECDVTGVTQLQLNVISRGLDAKSNYAVWAAPTLVK